MSGPLVVSFGGGIDSLAMLIALRDHDERPEAVVFSDTRGEKPETYDYMRDHVRPWLARNRFVDLTVVCRTDFGRSKTGDESLEAECLRLGNVPSRAFGFSTCADKWKIDPFTWWLSDAAPEWFSDREGWGALARPIQKCIGFEYGEERRISAFEERGCVKRYPLIEWRLDRDACVALIEGEGLPVPPKSACWFCPASTKPEVLWLARKHPDLAARAVDMEQRANATGRWAIKGLGRRFAWSDLLAVDPAQRELFPDAPVEACTQCNDGGCEVPP